jgi:3-phenylpropionate/cinnamic acid dioxygenase small subunit
MDDQAEIRHLMARYAQLADDRNAKGRAALFAADAHYFAGANELVGPAAIEAEIAARAASQPPERKTKHMLGNSVIDISGDRAEVFTDYVLMIRTNDSSPWEVRGTGRYHDRFVKTNGRWLYAQNKTVAQ